MIARNVRITSLLRSTRVFAKWYGRRTLCGVNTDEVNADPNRVETVSTNGTSDTDLKQGETIEKNVSSEDAEKKELVRSKNIKYRVLWEGTKYPLLLTRKAGTREKRQKNGYIMLEGLSYIKQALMTNVEPVGIFFSYEQILDELPEVDGSKLYKIPYYILESVTDRAICPGIIGVFKEPDLSTIVPSKDSVPLTFIIDSVSEPSNLAAIIKTAAGIGCEKLIIVRNGCVELWSPKVIESSECAHFLLPIHYAPSWECVWKILSDKYTVYIADSNAMQKEPLETTDRIQLSLPVFPWNKIDYTTSKIAVIAVGEKGEVSQAATQNLKSIAGRINIPLCNGMDSLNSAIAMSIIGFEVRRQYISKLRKTLQSDSS